jgi:hypothetical protein
MVCAKLFVMLVAIVSLTSTSAFVFDCRFLMFDWNFAGSRYTCDIRSITPSGSNTHVMGFTGSHLGGRNSSHVEGITINDERLLTQMPKGIEIYFPNLVALRWMRGSLSRITLEDIQPFPRLIRLSFENNPLVSIDEDIFMYSMNLRSISFNSVRLQHVSPSFISGLNPSSSVLSFADFSNNNCIDLRANSSSSILALQNALQTHCVLPTAPTTEMPSTPGEVPAKCTGECAERIEALETLLEQQLIINREYENRFLQLERQIREINANPCSSCN